MNEPTLYIFGGLPGTGKSALARVLAERTKSAYLRIDTIEQAMRDSGITLGGPEGYEVAYRLAADNLSGGLSVVADSVNPIEITRSAWRNAAKGVGTRFIEIEVVCSDLVEHRARVEQRSVDVPGLHLPTWEDVVNRDYQPWNGDHIIIDTAGQNLAQSQAALEQALAAW